MLVDVDEARQAAVAVLVVAAGDELDHVFPVVDPVEQQRPGRVDGPGQAQVVRVALGQVEIVEGARQLHRLQLGDADVLRVVDDIVEGRLVADAVPELQQAGLL